MKYFFLALTLLLKISLFSQSNFANDYTPIEIKSALPERYFGKKDEHIKRLVASQDILDEKSAEMLYSEIFSRLKLMFVNGYILYDSPITQYVQEIATNTFSGNPGVLDDITFYVTTAQEANAYTFPDGTILINIGLINSLDNESQLAFILAHEVAHYSKKHSLKAYKQWQILKGQKGDTEKEKLTYLNLFYSREHETEADGYGLSIITQSAYNANQAYDALSNIEKEDTSLASVKIELYNLLNSSYFQLDSSLLKFSQKFRPTTVQNTGNKYNIFMGDPDNTSSHPDIDKRKIAIVEILKSTEYKSENKLVNISENKFTEMKNIAMFESANNAYEDKEYFLSLAFSTALVKKYPENQFLHIMILKSIYWIAYYKDINNLDHMESDLPIFNRARYWIIGKMMNKAETNIIKKMAYGYGKKMQNLMEKNDDFYFYISLSVELYLGKEAANIFYMQYLNKFPKGKHAYFVNEKTQQL